MSFCLISLQCKQSVGGIDEYFSGLIMMVLHQLFPDCYSRIVPRNDRDSCIVYQIPIITTTPHYVRHLSGITQHSCNSRTQLVQLFQCEVHGDTGCQLIKSDCCLTHFQPDISHINIIPINNQSKLVNEIDLQGTQLLCNVNIEKIFSYPSPDPRSKLNKSLKQITQKSVLQIVFSNKLLTNRTLQRFFYKLICQLFDKQIICKSRKQITYK